MQLRRTAMLAIPTKPSEGHSRRCPCADPAGAVHHGEALAEYVDAAQLAALENIATPLALEERQAQEHVDARTEQQRMPHEFGGELERRIGDDRGDFRRREFHQEVDTVFVLVGGSVIDEIRRIDLMSGGAQHAHDGAGSARRLPDSALRQRLDGEQGARCAFRRLVEIVSALGQGRPLLGDRAHGRLVMRSRNTTPTPFVWSGAIQTPPRTSFTYRSAATPARSHASAPTSFARRVRNFSDRGLSSTCLVCSISCTHVGCGSWHSGITAFSTTSGDGGSSVSAAAFIQG